ncbi:MAG: lysylphosphatidylglycerol synthase transmembrane domain-containing protein [Sporomusaceae bacterium]|nr:lysylphosphatidylglycerol synthase transmembrane domain-containing protein [Sporomusaceae bacterium]
MEEFIDGKEHIVKHWKIIRLVIVCLVLWIALEKLDSRIFSDFTIEVVEAIFLVQPLIILTSLTLALRFLLLSNSSRRYLFVFLKANILSVGLNFFLPARMSELIKPIYLNNKVDAGLSRLTASTVIDRTIDAILLACASLIAFINFFTFNISKTIISIIMIVSIILIVIRFQNLMVALLTKFLGPRWGRFFESFIAQIKRSLQAGVFFQAAALGAAAWFLSFVQVYCFLSVAGKAPISLFDAFFVYIFVVLGAAIPALPGGLGTFEGAGVLALSQIGFGFQEGLVLAVGLHISQVLFGLLGTAVILSMEKIGIANLIRQIRESNVVQELNKKE